MQPVLIDIFRVPENARMTFLERAGETQSFIRTLPGFIEGFLYERIDKDGSIDFLTTAVWENEEAFENAKKTIKAKFAASPEDPRETLKVLGVEMQRVLYRRSPF